MRRSAAFCRRGLAAGSRGAALWETAAVALKATVFIAATCAHCRKSIRLGHWALETAAAATATGAAAANRLEDVVEHEARVAEIDFAALQITERHRIDVDLEARAFENAIVIFRY